MPQTIIRFETRQGHSVQLLIPPSRPGPSYFVLSVPKAGSILFNSVVEDLCSAARRSYFNISSQLFEQGAHVEDCPRTLLPFYDRDGYVFAGFRQPWLLRQVPRYRSATKLFLVRDPRDMAVSLYFSMRDSHPLPMAGPMRESISSVRVIANTIDVSSFVCQGHADKMLVRLAPFARQAQALPGFRIFRYEDIIWEKRSWCAEIARCLHMDLPEDVLNNIADRHDVRPDTERPTEHIRQVKPGNFRAHLDEQAIRYVETFCEGPMKFFNYAPAAA